MVSLARSATSASPILQSAARPGRPANAFPRHALPRIERLERLYRKAWAIFCARNAVMEASSRRAVMLCDAWIAAKVQALNSRTRTIAPRIERLERASKRADAIFMARRTEATYRRAVALSHALQRATRPVGWPNVLCDDDANATMREQAANWRMVEV